MRRKNTLLAVAAIGLSAGSIFAVQADTPLIVRIGGHNVDPKSDNGSLAADTLQVEVDDALGLTLNFSYFLAPNVVRVSHVFGSRIFCPHFGSMVVFFGGDFFLRRCLSTSNFMNRNSV